MTQIITFPTRPNPKCTEEQGRNLGIRIEGGGGYDFCKGDHAIISCVLSPDKSLSGSYSQVFSTKMNCGYSCLFLMEKPIFNISFTVTVGSLYNIDLVLEHSSLV